VNRNEIVAAVMGRAGVPATAARAAVDAVFGGASRPGLIAEALRRGERVQVAGFGTFWVRQRAARVGHDPRTRQKIDIPAAAAPAFRPATGLREHVKQDGLRTGAGAI
jgi:DNA-binding protein HU-beta